MPETEKIHVSPHVLRHTALRKLANEKGVHYAKKLSGHQTDHYIWRSVQPNEQDLADALDEVEEKSPGFFLPSFRRWHHN